MPSSLWRAVVCVSGCVAALAIAAPSLDVLLSLDAPIVALFSGDAAGLTAGVSASGGGWASTAFADVPEHTLFPEFVDIDLGVCTTLTTLALYAAPPDVGGFPVDFTVSVADAVRPRWRLAVNATNAAAPPTPDTAATFALGGVLGRFVRLSVTRVSGNLSASPSAAGGGWAAVRRVLVYGPPPVPGACPALDPAWPPPAPSCAPSVRSVSVQGLRADDGGAAAVVVDTPSPRVSWTLGACDRGARVSAFRVTVGSAPGSADAWDSGQQPADGADGSDTGVDYAGAPLRPATLYWVGVTLWDAGGEPTPPAASSRFLAAKLSPLQAEAWSGAWVGTGLPSAHRAVYLRSSFSLPAARRVERAVATFVGLGYGELALDGVKLGDALLAPGWTQYNVRSAYLTFDVTVELAAGGPTTHTIDVTLGDGWYAIEHDPWVHHLEKAVYVGPPKALLDIEVTYDDGSRSVFCTACNSTAPWQWSYGEITRAWVAAENIDARAAATRAWQPAATVLGPPQQFPGALLVAQVELPTRVQGEDLLPQLHTVHEGGPTPYIGGGAFCKAADAEMVFWVAGYPNGTAKYMLDPGACEPCPSVDACGHLVTVSDAYLAALPTAATNFSCSQLPVAAGDTAHVFDFGREFQGVVRLSLAGPAGANATLLPCGSMYGRCTAATEPSEVGGPDLSRFTLAGTGGAEVYLPRFMYTSVRTLVVKHSTSIDPASVTVVGVRVAMDAPTVGSFACSDATYTWLHDAVVRTQANYVTGMPNDPTREKKGWTQDIMTMGPSALLVHGDSAQRMYSRWISDILDNQAADGLLPEVAPGPVLNDGYNGAWWGGQGVWGPALLYGHSSDARRDLAPRYAAMRAFVLYLNASADAAGDVAWGLGDWLAVSSACMHNATLINTPALAAFAGILSDAAALLEPAGAAPPGDAALFGVLAASVATRYFAQFLDPASGALAPGEQCTQALALALQLGLPRGGGGAPAPFTPAALRPALERALLARLAADNATLTTGFVTFGFMLQVLADLAPAVGQAVLTQRGGSGPWLNSAGSGHDLCKEQWDGGDAEMPSLCGPLVAWSFAALAGVRPPGAPASSASAASSSVAPVASSPGWRIVSVKPNAGSDAGGLTWVDAAFETPRGGVRVSWTLTAANATDVGVLRLLVAVPPGAAGVVHVPTLDAARVLESGRPAASQPGVAFLTQTTAGRAVFAVDGGGTYAFEAPFAPSGGGGGHQEAVAPSGAGRDAGRPPPAPTAAAPPSPLDEAPARLWPCDGSVSQTWRVVAGGGLDDNVLLGDTGLCLNELGAGGKLGGVLNAWRRVRNPAQQWVVAGGQLRNGALCAGTENATGVLAGTPVLSVACRGDAGTTWAVDAASGAVRLAAQPGLCLSVGFATNCSAPPLAGLPYCDPDAPTPVRVADLLARLTQAEGIALLGASNPGVPRLGVPPIEYGEALHGVLARCGHAGSRGGSGCATSFPCGVAMAAALNRTLWRAAGLTVASEARALHNQVPSVASAVFFAPDLNPARDPRWGRAQEVPGEDPTLCGSYGAAWISGFQDTGASTYPRAISMVKHFSTYDQEGNGGVHNRGHFCATVEPRFLTSYFWPPFVSAIKDGGVGGIMCSANGVNGVASCAHSDYNNGVLRGTYGWDGFMVTDGNGIGNLWRGYGPDPLGDGCNVTAVSPTDACRAGLRGGVDVELGVTLTGFAAEAIADGNITYGDVTTALNRTLTWALKLGLLDPPSRVPWAALGPDDVDTPAARALALEGALQAMTLLQNNVSALSPWGEGTRLLPLRTAQSGPVRTIALIGPNLRVTQDMLSNYHGENTVVEAHSPLLAITARAARDGVAVTSAPGCLQVNCTTTDFPAALAVARAADVVVAFLGLQPWHGGPGGAAAGKSEGEEYDRDAIALPGAQDALLAALVALGKPVVVVLMHGGAVGLEHVQAAAPAVLEAYYPGQAGGDAIAAVLFGDSSPAGRLPYTAVPSSFVATRAITDYDLTSGEGITHLWYRGWAVWPFGWGLSYTTFAFDWADDGAAVEVDAAAWAAGAPAPAFALRVTNTGAVTSDATVLAFWVPRLPGEPLQKLADHARVAGLAPGATATVLVTLPAAVAATTNALGDALLTPGDCVLRVGDVAASGNFVERTVRITGARPAPLFVMAEALAAAKGERRSW